MTDPVILFAMSLTTKIAPCYHLVSRWLVENGVENVPSDSKARRLWFCDGPENGLAQAAKDMGLIERPPHPGDVAVIDQGEGEEPILGIVAHDGFVVIRSFGVLAVGRPGIIKSWGIPWAA